MRNVCWDGYYCCQPNCYEINNNPWNPGNNNPCDDCMLIGSYYVHDHESVPPGCPGEGSNLLIPLNRNNYDACDNAIVVSIWNYDMAYFENVEITHEDGETFITLRIKTEIPHMEYREIIYKIMCSDGHGGFGKVKIASKHLCLDCECDCDECTGDCDDPC